MIAQELKKPLGERIDYALIVTPNHVHFDPAMKCIKAGIPVFCEKPLTVTLDEADTLVEAVKEAKIPFGVAHTYLGHWTTRFARFIVTSGLIGDVRWVDAYYIQGWLAGRTEDQGVMQAEWRVDPKKAGASCCGGDIGTHALMHLRYITGSEVTRCRATSRRSSRVANWMTISPPTASSTTEAGRWSELRRSPSDTRMIWGSRSTARRVRSCGGRNIRKS